MTTAMINCVGCRALVPDLPAMYGPAHTYLGASPGCWQLYTELTARAVSSLTVRGLMADTYMVQHPGVESRQAIQSVARHLLGLHYALERGIPFEQAVRLMSSAPVSKFRWLEPPASLGAITVVDIAQTCPDQILEPPIRQWAITTWQVWAPYHKTIQEWAVLSSRA